LPKNHSLQNPPFAGEEDRWINSMKAYKQRRELHLKDVKHAMYFAEILLPQSKAYCDWFTTPGGIADGTSCLEKDFLNAEDSVIGKWKDQFLDVQGADKSLKEDTDEKEAAKIRVKAREMQKLVDVYHKYQREIYQKEPQFEYAKKRWQEYEQRADKICNRKRDALEEAKKEAMAKTEAERKKMREDYEKQQEEKKKQKEDIFYVGQDPEDDPFADVKIKTLKL